MYHIINLSILLTFSWLCLQKPPDVSYDIAGLDKLVMDSKPLTHAQRQAMAIAEVYGVTDEWKPVNIYGESK